MVNLVIEQKGIELTPEGVIVDSFTEIIGENGIKICDLGLVLLLNSFPESNGKVFYVTKLAKLSPIDFNLYLENAKKKLNSEKFSNLETLVSDFIKRYENFYVMADLFIFEEERLKFRNSLEAKKDGNEKEKLAYEIYNNNILRWNNVSVCFDFIKDLISLLQEINPDSEISAKVLKKIGSFLRIIWKDRSKIKVSADPDFKGFDVDDLIRYAEIEEAKVKRIIKGEKTEPFILDPEATTFFCGMAEREIQASPNTNCAEKMHFIQVKIIDLIKEILQEISK